MTTKTTAKHTPGPWTIQRINNEVWPGPYLVVVDPVTKQTLAKITRDHGGMAIGESAANARLIAAAPDLLHALKFLTDAASAEPAMAIYKAHIEQAQAAINRAEGK